MSQTSPKSGFWNYVAECLRLLYWIYFKPFTFERWLRDIHPELKPIDNPFNRRVEFRTNPRLRRYAGQVWWLTALAPMFSVLLVAPVYMLLSGKSFEWFVSFIFCSGWLMGRVLDRGFNRNRLVTLFFAALILLLTLRFLSGVAVALALGLATGLGGLAMGLGIGLWMGLVLSVTYSMAFSSVVLGLGGSMAVGLALGVAIGLGMSLALCVSIGWAQSIARSWGISYEISAATGGVEVGGIMIGLVGGSLLSSILGSMIGLAGSLAVGLAWFFGVLRIYFWLAELLWMFILFCMSRFQKPKNYLKYLPPRFDQLIILPLPFMDTMIMKAYQENPNTARETIDYLITFTNKQQVALQAIIKITVESLHQCRKLGDVADIASQLTWIPSPPPPEIGTILPQLLDISQGVKASQEATTSYRQYELLKPPINALQELKNTLIFAKNAALATQFGSITNRWLTILETAQRTLEETAKKSQEISQVYIASNSLDPTTAKNRFKGRIDIFREIETLTLADQPEVLLLYGGRKTGKTSALKYLPYKIGANIVPLLVDLQGGLSATTLKGLAENLAQQIIEAARRLPRKIFLPHPDADKLAEDPFPALQTWLAEIERSNSGKRFLLCLDEYERLSEVVAATNSRAPLNFIRNLLQHQKQWLLLFSGSHQLSELDAYWTDYLINTRALRMSYLQESEARELITCPIEDFSNIYESNAVDLIIHLTHCQPYLVQLMCYELVEFLNKDIRANRRQLKTIKATAQDVQEIIPIVLERGTSYFREIWNNLTENDRNLLQRIIQDETPTPQDKGTVRRLTRKEILTQEGNAFQVPLVQKYIEQLLEEEN
ncbi:AAA family ATPase [Nostoc sp. FACHB-190]|uniref:nSTAND1 domain-containing NTPase n=1 Tax=Nostoc sp. FACHB-190 TaxID=2692838 RepID=UPI001687A47D|nr:AAA family ATPase [Nostoc sp. FACHB-190]MBD2301627.1 AAA family ATPase [Nostoc sp. FACHB-190]